jgi:pyruvate formate lyase activating enzyme
MAQFLAGISPDIPWHVTAFHSDYKMNSTQDTPPATLLRAAKIGTRAGLRYVYAGNLPGRTEDWENTRCPNCSKLLVERFSLRILQYNFTPKGECPACGYAIPGRWAVSYQGQTASTPFLPNRRARAARFSSQPS